MKKIAFMAVTAIAALSLASCGTRPATANLKNDIDSLSYASGAQMAERFNQYNVLEQIEVDSAYIADFVRGLNEAFNNSDDKRTNAYNQGIGIGLQLLQGIDQQTKQFFPRDTEDSLKELSKQNYLAAFVDVVRGTNGALNKEQYDSVANAFQKKLQEAQMARQREMRRQSQAEQWARLEKENIEEFGAWKAQNDKFLADNALKEGVMTTASGLQYKVITEGEGEKPTEYSYVKVNYEGKLIDGTVFDSSFERDQPAQFSLLQVIEGWTEVLQLMPVGSEFEVYVPQYLGYGPENKDKIKPFSTLIFKIQLLDILQ